MKVELLSHTPNPVKLIYTACKTCCSKDLPEHIYNDDQISEDDMLKLVEKVINAGHTSVLEHVSVSFSLEMSRSCSHQLVRKRIGASPSQQSQRYCCEENFKFITPTSITLNNDLWDEYSELMDTINSFYKKLHQNGIPNEDARYVLPNACTTTLTYTFNLRSLMDLANERLCGNSQYEIRLLLSLICWEISNIDELKWFTKYMVPKCKRYGKCTEIRPCGRM